MDYATSLEELKNQVEQFRAGRKRVTWSKAIRTRAAELMAAGIKTTAIHNATGISYSSLHGWQNRKRFKEVKVTEVQSQDLTLRLSGGALDIEIENLSTSAVVEILERFL